MIGEERSDVRCHWPIIALVISKLWEKDSKDSQLTDVRVVVSGPEPPGWPVTGGQHQDREQRRRDSLEPRYGQQHPPVEFLHQRRIKRIGAFLSLSIYLYLPRVARVRATTISRDASARGIIGSLLSLSRFTDTRLVLVSSAAIVRLASYLRSA